MNPQVKYSDEVKAECVRLYQQGARIGYLYDEVFKKEYPDSSYSKDTFRSKLHEWEKAKKFADISVLQDGTFRGFIAKNATVQVDGKGQITQAWVKQSKEDFSLEEALEMIAEKVPKKPKIAKKEGKAKKKLLEIPLFDMHFGVNTLADYDDTKNGILELICSRKWDTILIVIGQDLLHNNDMRGHTAKGTPIEKVNMEQAFHDAVMFYDEIITEAIRHSVHTSVVYSEGNHDEMAGWCAYQALAHSFGKQVKCEELNMRWNLEGTRQPHRKCFFWNGVFIGFGHCDDGRTDARSVRMAFTSEFKEEYAKAKACEIHLGHLHTEKKDEDIGGIVVRRLSTANQTDSWHRKNGYVGNHKRFQVFEYSPNWLDAIHYV